MPQKVANTRTGFRTALLCLCAYLLMPLPAAVHAQETLPCIDRPHYNPHPWVNGTLYCLEDVALDPSGGVLSFTALTTDAEGRLYAARPLAGEVYTFEDSDGDGLQETPRLLIDGLTQPNALAFHDGALYIAGGAHLYRWQDDTLTVLVDDLPSGGGFWTGGLTLAPDAVDPTQMRLYVGIGAPCDHCIPDDPLRGTILSFALDGSDRRVEAQGVRHPAALATLHNSLWFVDSARDHAAVDYPDQPLLDELNRLPLTAGETAHFGFPHCIGANIPDLRETAFDCGEAYPAALPLPTGSRPAAIAAYTSDTIPRFTNHLLLVLNGDYNSSRLINVIVVLVTLDERGDPTGSEVIMPEATNPTFPALSVEALNLQGSGFWPERPLNLTISPEGWVYVSVTSGRIFVLRPL